MLCLAHKISDKLEPHKHHPVQHQRHETNQCMRANTLGQSVVHRADLDVRFKHPKAALNVGQTFVTLHHVSGGGAGVGHQQQLAIKQLQVLDTSSLTVRSTFGRNQLLTFGRAAQ